MLKSFVYRLSLSSARHPWWILGGALIISTFAILATTHLPVYTSRQALLPQNTDVAHRLNQYLDTFGASSDLVVILENAPREDLESFAKALSAKLRTLPEIAQSTERVDTGFLHDHLYLLLPASQLDQLEQALKTGSATGSSNLASMIAMSAALGANQDPGAIDLQQALTGIRTATAFLEEWLRWLSPTFSGSDVHFEDILKAAGAEQLGKGYFSSHDGRMLLVFVHAKAKGEDFESLAPLNEKVRDAANALRKDYEARGLKAPNVVLTGLPAIAYEEYIDIERDIKLVIWTAAGLIGALIFLVVRSIPWALAIFIPMGLGALWSLGFAYLTVGHLTIITSSFLAILFGLGADYGIFTTSQIAEYRRTGMSLIQAIGEGIRDSSPAVITAGGASLLIFGTLATVEFPGFAELGIIAAGGVLLILISTWVVQPAIYALLPPKIRSVPAKKANDTTRPFPKSAALMIVVLASTGAAFGIHAGLDMEFDYDVLSLLPKDSQAAEYQRKLVTETDYQSEIIIFTAKTLEDIRRITEGAQKLPSIAKVQSISSFFPADAADRLEDAHRIGKLASSNSLRQNLSRLSDQGLNEEAFFKIRQQLRSGLEKLEDYEEQAFSSGNKDLVNDIEHLHKTMENVLIRLEEDPQGGRSQTQMLMRALLEMASKGLTTLGGWQKAQTLSPQDLPDGIRERFVAPDGTLAAYAYPSKSVYNPENLDELMKEVYSVAPDATGFPSTHQVFSKAVVSSFSHGTKAAIIVCLAWLFLVIRSPKGVLMAALPLVIGGGWMLGIMKVAGLHYNYANIIALPLVIALAVDYGVWLSHRWMILGGNDPVAIAKDAGRVILLAAGTELAGLGAITLASYRGVSGLGIDITIGLLTCLASTLLIAPAIGLILVIPWKKTK